MIAAPEWSGRTVVCIASGPSLTKEDAEKVRASGHPVVVTNNTYQMAPWADVLFAFDAKWWKVHHEDVKGRFAGRRFGGSMLCENYGANPGVGLPWLKVVANSGACAISLAIGAGAARVVLLAYDLSLGPCGESHWHGAHAKELSNAESMGNWPAHFRLVARYARERGVEVLNASRRTALEAFPRVQLEDVL